MARYYDMDHLKKLCEAKSEMVIGDAKLVFASVVAWLSILPPADVVEVVRCKECKHREILHDRVMCSKSAHRSEDGVWFGLRATGDHHFCSYGERKEQP